MADFDKEGEDLDVLRESLNVNDCEYESADAGCSGLDVNTGVWGGETLGAKKDFDVLNEKHSQISSVLETANLTFECDNEILINTDGEAGMEEERSCNKNCVQEQLNNIENLKKQKIDPSTERSVNNKQDDSTTSSADDTDSVINKQEMDPSTERSVSKKQDDPSTSSTDAVINKQEMDPSAEKSVSNKQDDPSASSTDVVINKQEMDPSTESGEINTIHNYVVIENQHNCSSILQNNFANGTAHAVPDSDPKEAGRKKKGVSFPLDNSIISGYLDPPDPWKNAPQWTTDELVSAYKNSCDLNGTKPIAKLISQLQVMNSESQPEELLSLKGEKLDQKQCECLEEILKRAQFKLLDFEACHLDEESAVALFDMIEFYESACQLNIAFNKNIQARGWQACSKLVRRTPNLTFLDMRNCDLNDRTIPIFGRALKLGCHLTILHMENMSLSGRPLLILVAAVKTNEVLQELFLAENKLVPTDGVHLGNLLLYNHKLRLLDLRNNHLQDVGTGHICDGLMEQNKGYGLRTLVLWNNAITYQAMSALGRALASSQNLETLNIGHNGITNEGTHQLKDGLLRLNSLLRLGLQGSKISDEGAVALAEYIADTKVLLRIDLRDNDIRTAGLMALSHAMRVNTSVTRIDLDKEAKKEPGIKDYVEQQGRLIGDILTFQQRNLQIAVKKEEQDRLLLKEKFELEMAAAQKEAEKGEQNSGSLPANCSTESFTLIDDVMEKEAAQETHTNNSDIFDAQVLEERHHEHVSSENNDDVDTLDCLNYEEDKKCQNRPLVLFPLQVLSPQTSLDSPVLASHKDHFAITTSDSHDGCVSPSSGSSKTKVSVMNPPSAPAEMILSPQYFPKQIARKIFSVQRVKEDTSCTKPSSSAGASLSVSYDPLSVSPVPLVSVSSSASLPPLTSSLSEPQHAVDGAQQAMGVAQHSKCKPQATSPSSLLLQDLAEETIRHMVSSDMDRTSLAANKPELGSSTRAVDKHDINRDFNLENSPAPALEFLNKSLDLANCTEASFKQPVSELQTGVEVYDYPKTLLLETESSKVSASAFREQSDADDSGKISSSEISDLSLTGDISLEDQATLQQTSGLPAGTTEKTQLPPETCFISQEFDPKQTNLDSGQEDSFGNYFVTEDGDYTSKEATVATNGSPTESDPELSFVSPFFSIEDSPESCASFTVSKNEMPAFLDLGADNMPPHGKVVTEKVELFQQCHHVIEDVSEDSQRVFLVDENHSVVDLHSKKEPVSVCLNNYSSPSLLVSQELSSASLQEKSVISQFTPGGSQERSFSSIVDLLRLDICEMSDRKDMQAEAVMTSSKTSTTNTSDELVNVVNDNIDIDNVEFGLDEEPWLSVGVEVDGSEADASKKSLKQPDFFTTLSMNGLTQELASALTSLDGSNSPFDGEDYHLDS